MLLSREFIAYLSRQLVKRMTPQIIETSSTESAAEMIGNLIEGQLSTPSAGQGAILSLIVLLVLLVPMIYYVVQTNRASQAAS